MPQGNKINLSIIIPAFNEVNLIKKSLTKLILIMKKCSFNYELIIIDDGSTDETLEKVYEFKKINSKIEINIIYNNENIGKTASLVKGFKVSKGQYIIIHDADLEYDPNDIIRLYDEIISDTNLKAVYGSRYLEKNYNNKQQYVYYIANIINLYLFNFLFNSKLTDLHSCYKIFKQEILINYNFRSKRFGFELEISAFLFKENLFLKEIPIKYKARNKVSGKKINFIDEINFLYNIVRLRFFI